MNLNKKQITNMKSKYKENQKAVTVCIRRQPS